MASMEYWDIDDAVNQPDENKVQADIKSNVDSVSINPNWGQYLGNQAMTIARSVPRTASYLADIPNLIAEGVAWGKNKSGLLDQRNYGDTGYQGFGTAIANQTSKEDYNPLLNIYKPHGRNWRDANPSIFGVGIFDDVNKIDVGDPDTKMSWLLPTEQTTRWASDFALFDKFGLNKIPRFLGGKTGYNNPFGGNLSAQAIKSAVVGGGAYNLGMFDSLGGIATTVVADILGRKIIGTNLSNQKQYIHEILGGHNLNKQEYASWVATLKPAQDLDRIFVEWTGKGRSVADIVNDPKVSSVITLLEGTPMGQQILGNYFFQRGLQFDKTVQERFGKYIDDVKKTDAHILGNEIINNLVKHYDETNNSWKAIINDGPTPLSSKVSTEFSLDMNKLWKDFEINSGNMAVNNKAFIENQIIKNFFNVKKVAVRKANGKIAYDKSGNKIFKNEYTFKEFKNIDELITRRNEINAQLNKSTNKSDIAYGMETKEFLAKLDDIIANNVSGYKDAQKMKSDAVTRFNKVNESTVEIFGAWGDLSTKGGTTAGAGANLISKTMDFMKNNPSSKTINQFIKLLDSTGQAHIIDTLMPYYIQSQIKGVVKEGQKGSLNSTAIYKALTENSASYDNLNRWFNAINKNATNPNTRITHASFQKSLNEFTAISEKIFKPVKNSATSDKQQMTSRLSNSLGSKLFRIFKLEADMGLVKSFENWKYLTETRVLSELLTSSDGVAMLNALSRNASKENRWKIVESIYKINTASYSDKIKDKQRIVEENNAEQNLQEAHQEQMDIINYWESME